jgi:aspartate/methionine/tyrosine aminotransferase
VVLVPGGGGRPAPPAPPAGAFFAWVDITATGLSDREFALRLLAEHRVSVAPGTAFGTAGAGFVRLSLTADDDDVAAGAKRLVEFVDSLTR